MRPCAMRLGGTVVGLLLLGVAAHAQVLRVADLTSTEIAALDRDRTVVILPGGILEQHGPYLPTFSDGILNARLADTLALSISLRPGWRALVFPMLPLGNSAANDIGARYSYAGTYAVRFETLRAVFMDLADELGAQGFKWILVVHLHGGPNHSRALDDAGDYFQDTYGGVMVHLAGLMPVLGALEGPKSASERAADGLPIHAGMDETSLIQFLAPSLVRAGWESMRDQSSSTMEGLESLARLPDWPGYFGAPRLASSAHGAIVWRALADSTVSVARRLLEGEHPARGARYAREMESSSTDVRLDAASRRAEGVRAARQTAWIRARGHP